jgi:hypothetical protein
MKAWACGSIIGILLLIGSMTWATPAEAPRRVIIDTDPGTDDALAILLALNSPELKVEALTVVPGNVTASQGLESYAQWRYYGGRNRLSKEAAIQSKTAFRTLLLPGAAKPQRSPAFSHSVAEQESALERRVRA